jgi:predicted transcriptional regulator
MMDFACRRISLDEVIKCGLGLTKSDFIVLSYFIKHRTLFSTKDISDALKLDISTVQRTVKKLFEKSILERNQINLAEGGYQFEYRARKKEEIKRIVLGIVESWSKRVEDEFEKWSG